MRGRANRQSEQESGVVLLAMVLILLPLVLLVGAFTTTMSTRTKRLMSEATEERALLAAESGIDLGIWIAQVGWISDGMKLSFSMGPDTRFEIVATYLRSDGVDNDGDSRTDESDEDVYQIESRGTFQRTSRRLAAYLGPIPAQPLSFPGAMAVHNPGVRIDLKGTPRLSGYNTNIDGTPGDPAEDKPGLSIAAPGTVADLLAELTGGERTKVVGPGGSPSLGVGAPSDLPSMVAAVQNSADVVLTNSQYSSFSFGSGLAGTATIAYRDGDLKLMGNTTGAGILVVMGDLEMTGNFRYDGVIVVLGSVTAGAGTAMVNGAIVQGPFGSSITVKGTFDLRYSAEAISLANLGSGQYVSFTGWQELAR